MDLEQALALNTTADGWTAVVPPGWSQGRTTFGGLLAGYLVRAVEAAHDRGVRSVDVYFLEPVGQGPVQLRETSRREGKYLTHSEITLMSDRTPAVVGRFVLADDEPGAFDAAPAVGEPERSFEESPVMPYLEGITPEFTRNLDVRYGEGDVPFSGSPRAVTGGFVRNRGPARGVAALLTHIDVWPPPTLALSTTPGAASTVRWHVQFHAPIAVQDGEQWSWFRSEAPWRSGRLATAVGSLVRDGRNVAFCEQTVAMYAGR